MHVIVSIFLLFFAGWTLATHGCVLLGLNLRALLLLSPCVMVVLFGTYFLLPEKQSSDVCNRNIFWGLDWSNNKKFFPIMLGMLLILPVCLYCSWVVFWAFATFLLGLCLVPYETGISENLNRIRNSRKLDSLIIILIIIAAIILSYWVSRSDLDDAFYGAIAAFSSANPEQSLLAADPMLGEPGLPLLFPSYRFATFELLSGAVAYLLSIPALDVYYIYLLPLWVILAVVAIFLLTRELVPQYWLPAGAVTFLFVLLLGEMHRSPANFSFVRLFQGKAVFLSVMVPIIFYLTARFFSKRGNYLDLFLLACCQISSIGLTNFGMLAGPLAILGALASNVPLILKGEIKKLYPVFAILLIPLPYLINVALQSKGSPIIELGNETAANVWVSVFGIHQQYLVGVLLLAGPILAKDTIMRWRLAVPPLLLFGIYLNPWLSSLISRYLTTPPVYWRIVWSFPILIFAAISFCMVLESCFEKKSRLLVILLAMTVFGLTIYALPFNTLRSENIDSYENFAAWKIRNAHLVVAQKAVTINCNGSLLAPDEIAGIISRFEKHPKLVSTRGAYLNLMSPAISDIDYKSRYVLYNFVMGKIEEKNEDIRIALRMLNVSVIVMPAKNESLDVVALLKSEKYTHLVKLKEYSIWKR